MLPPDPFCMAADNADYVQNTGKPAKAGPVLRMAFNFSAIRWRLSRQLRTAGGRDPSDASQIVDCCFEFGACGGEIAEGLVEEAEAVAGGADAGVVGAETETPVRSADSRWVCVTGCSARTGLG